MALGEGIWKRNRRNPFNFLIKIQINFAFAMDVFRFKKLTVIDSRMKILNEIWGDCICKKKIGLLRCLAMNIRNNVQFKYCSMPPMNP